MLGYENHELRQHVDQWRDLLHPDDIERVMDILQGYLDKKREQYVVEFRLCCKDGSYKWILAGGQAQWDEDGKPVRMVGSHQDISERKQAEIELHCREQEFRAEVQKKVFNPFFTTKPVGKGTGLGLAISYQLVVEKHCGRLQCISTTGQGTEFLIFLPIEQQKIKE